MHLGPSCKLVDSLRMEAVSHTSFYHTPQLLAKPLVHRGRLVFIQQIHNQQILVEYLPRAGHCSSSYRDCHQAANRSDQDAHLCGTQFRCLLHFSKWKGVTSMLAAFLLVHWIWGERRPNGSKNSPPRRTTI